MAGKPQRRSQVPAGGGRPKGRAPAATGSHLKHGRQARQQAKTEAENARKQGNAPWRFWLRGDTTAVDPETVCDMYPEGLPKNECGIIILDDSLDSIVGQHEHNLRIGGKYGNFEACPKEFDNCALCDGGDKGYYAVFFTILALKPWTSKDGKRSGMATRMLLAVKSTQLAKLEETLAIAEKQNGTLRGTYLYMRRDTSNQQSANTGEPTTLDTGMAFDFYTEEELVAEFGHPAVRSPEGKVLKPENADITVFDYEEIFPKPDGADLRKRYGGYTQPGSKEEAEEEWNKPDQPAKRTAPRRRPAPAQAGSGTEPEGSGDTDDDNLPFSGGDEPDYDDDPLAE